MDISINQHSWAAARSMIDLNKAPEKTRITRKKCESQPNSNTDSQNLFKKHRLFDWRVVVC